MVVGVQSVFSRGIFPGWVVSLATDCGAVSLATGGAHVRYALKHTKCASDGLDWSNVVIGTNTCYGTFYCRKNPTTFNASKRI